MVAKGNVIKAGSKAYIDMISWRRFWKYKIRLIKRQYLQITARFMILREIPLQAHIQDRSCRIYAKPDALACKYMERNTGREIQGWRGFCAESDPKNPEYCLQWWPIDLISGEDISKF